MKRVRGVAILGSTGSIGVQALDVIAIQKKHLRAVLLVAKNNHSLLVQQAKKFKPESVVIANPKHYKKVKSSLSGLPIKVYSGESAILSLVGSKGVDVVLTAMVGYSGLAPTIAAIKAKKNIALANKEALVVAGEIIVSLCKEYKAKIYPVDSEHSAIFQCLVGEKENRIEKLYLTASGGPFRGMSLEDLLKITKKEALAHPNWNMGPKITIDSATLMNKGLEVIEAKWLFGIDAKNINVVVHPQSIIHSAVRFEDGSVKAQIGIPDMKLPIQYALGFPKRLKNSFSRFSFLDYPKLTFEKPNKKVFRNLELAYTALDRGGNSPCVLNAANEVAVAAFLKDRIGFVNMSDLIENCLEKITFVANPCYEDLIETNKEAIALANTLL